MQRTCRSVSSCRETDAGAVQLLLKETIDRLRFDLEEMRTAARKSVLDGGDSASGSMAFGTVSKSLGRELARRLVQEEEAGPKENVDDAASGESEGEEEVDDIVVTTHRRIVSAVRRCTSSELTLQPRRRRRKRAQVHRL